MSAHLLTDYLQLTDYLLPTFIIHILRQCDLKLHLQKAVQ